LYKEPFGLAAAILVPQKIIELLHKNPIAPHLPLLIDPLPPLQFLPLILQRLLRGRIDMIPVINPLLLFDHHPRILFHERMGAHRLALKIQLVLDSANTAADLPLGFAGHFELGEGLEGST
jgi:hypothetical protein